jgi:hypothetical protein
LIGFAEQQSKGLARYLLDADLGGEPLHIRDLLTITPPKSSALMSRRASRSTSRRICAIRISSRTRFDFAKGARDV